MLRCLFWRMKSKWVPRKCNRVKRSLQGCLFHVPNSRLRALRALLQTCPCGALLVAAQGQFFPRWIANWYRIVKLPFPLFKKIFLNIYLLLRDRERQTVNRGGTEREGDTEFEAGSRLWAVSTEPNVGFELTNCEIMTWAEVRCLTYWAIQAPLPFWIYNETPII